MRFCARRLRGTHTLLLQVSIERPKGVGQMLEIVSTYLPDLIAHVSSQYLPQSANGTQPCPA